ncbi:alpha/beta fold hydrolase [Cognatishimia maritima]|uniref:Pimeloyl-ACP methyl ester carboxylesterase n=1 Tax=Cognatishimia maritima TaxID=870908 RepID=A0A1M5NWY5_9RHOB|nr:alpha/beta fold hydrolase [Cognatishimia maritima]SHG94020.1 Pimeloyl-ACP methyl ester carboxylesterase [Cognatishimia maritima]
MTPVVFLPGMMCDARLFGPQIDALSARYPVMCHPLVGTDTIEGLARQVLDASPQRFALAGLSMGGIVAMEILRQAPDRVDRLALLDTNPLAEKDDVKAKRLPQIKAAQSGELRRVMRDEMKPNYLADGPNQGAILDLCMVMATDLGPEVFVDQSRALAARRDQCDTLRAYAGPSLVLMGEDDSLCPMDRHTLMHDLLTNSTLSVIQGAGHLPTLEQPQDTTAALRHWLET